MQYLGGKSRLGARIVQAILDDLGVKRLTLAVDLCSGAGGVTHRLADVSDRVTAVEAHPGLVALHKAVQDGPGSPQQERGTVRVVIGVLARLFTQHQPVVDATATEVR